MDEKAQQYGGQPRKYYTGHPPLPMVTRFNANAEAPPATASNTSGAASSSSPAVAPASAPSGAVQQDGGGLEPEWEWELLAFRGRRPALCVSSGGSSIRSTPPRLTMAAEDLDPSRVAATIASVLLGIEASARASQTPQSRPLPPTQPPLLPPEVLSLSVELVMLTESQPDLAASALLLSLGDDGVDPGLIRAALDRREETLRRSLSLEENAAMGTWATVFERLPLRGDIVPVWSHTDETGTYACIRLKLKPALVLLGLEPAQRGELQHVWPIAECLAKAAHYNYADLVTRVLASSPHLLDYHVELGLPQRGAYDCAPVGFACMAPLSEAQARTVQAILAAVQRRALQHGVEPFHKFSPGLDHGLYSAEFNALQQCLKCGNAGCARLLLDAGVPADGVDPDLAAALDRLQLGERPSHPHITDDLVAEAMGVFGGNHAMALGYLVGRLRLEDRPPHGGWAALDPGGVKAKALRDKHTADAQIRDLRSQMLFAESTRLREELLREQRDCAQRRGNLLLAFVCNPDHPNHLDDALPQALNDALAASHAVPASIIGGTAFSLRKDKPQPVHYKVLKRRQEAQAADRDCTFERLEAELAERGARGRSPCYFLFSGHANLHDEGRPKRLGFTDSEGNLAPADNDRVAALLGEHARTHPGSSGTIELVVLNGCGSLDLGRKCRSRGVPVVVCWETDVQDEAAYLFVRGFFRSLAESRDFEVAFRAGKAAVRSKTRLVLEGARTRTVPFFELTAPGPEPAKPLPSGSFAAGVPAMLTK